MNYRQLLKESSDRLKHGRGYLASPLSRNVFSNGARWMHDRLNETGQQKTVFNDDISFGLYGWLKYGVCLTAFLITAIGFYQLHIFFMPLSVLVFYFCEVQLLFLFPLLIDGVRNPVWASIKQTWRIGIWKAITVVIPVSIFMLLGLFNIKAPLRNWYAGSLAIIIWYQYEVRDRLQ